MGGGPFVIRRPAVQKSNTEFISSLRANFAHAIQQRSSHEVEVNGSGRKDNNLPNGDRANSRPSFLSWSKQEVDTIYIPSIDFSRSGVAEERAQYEITVKLFFLPNKPASCRCAQTREAVNLVLRELHVQSIDLLIVSYPGIAFDADDEDDADSDDIMNGTGEDDLSTDARAEDIDTMIKTWGCLEELHDEGVIAKLGVSEFGTERLSKFLKQARVRPSVNQINVRDCCVVPKPLILFAKREKIELLTHNDCTNILPRGTVREMLGPVYGGVGVLAGSEPDTDGLRGDVEPQWVSKYTAVVRNRGVIENKGYFALAELKDE